MGDFPRTLEYNPGNNNIYVANQLSGDVSVIDSSTNTVIKTVDVGQHLQDLEYNPSNGYIYVANQGSNDVSVIDSSTNTVVATVGVDNGPLSLEYNPSNNNIYTANEGSTTVSVIATSNNSLVDTITVGDTPRKVVYNPHNNNIYVSNSHSDDVSVIQTVIPPLNQEPKTIGDLIKGTFQNPLDVTNSIDSANEIRDILTDDNRDNDEIVYDLINSEDENTSNIRDILDC